MSANNFNSVQLTLEMVNSDKFKTPKECFLYAWVSQSQKSLPRGFQFTDQHIADKLNISNRVNANRMISGMIKKGLLKSQVYNGIRTLTSIKLDTSITSDSIKLDNKLVSNLITPSIKLDNTPSDVGSIKVDTQESNKKLILENNKENKEAEQVLDYFMSKVTKFKNPSDQLPFAKKLLKRHELEYIMQAIDMCAVAKENKWSGKFQYMPKISTLQQLNNNSNVKGGDAIDRVHNNGMALVGETVNNKRSKVFDR